MAKKPLITENDRANIAMVFRENPKERADVIQSKVVRLSHRDIGLSTIQRELVSLRKAHKEGQDKDEKDGPWNIGSTVKYPIQTQHISTIARYAKQWEQLKCVRLTIRQVQWVDRLCDMPLNKEYQDLLLSFDPAKGFTPKMLNLGQDLGNAIVVVASMFSEFERWAEIQGTTLDTSRFDDEYLEVIGEKIKVYVDTLKKRKEGNNG